MNKYVQDMGEIIVNNEELKQMSGDELIGIIKAQRFEIKEKDLLIQELRDTIDNQKETIDRLNNIINTILEFSFFKEECPLNFGFGDEKEEKAQDVFYEDDYCEKNCNDIYKKCWLKYFEKLQKLKENNK